MRTKPWPRGGPFDLRRNGHLPIYRKDNKAASTDVGETQCVGVRIVTADGESHRQQKSVPPVLSNFFRVSAGRTPTHELFVCFGTLLFTMRRGARRLRRGQGAGGGRNEEVGTMSDELRKFLRRSSPIIPSSAFLSPSALTP